MKKRIAALLAALMLLSLAAFAEEVPTITVNGYGSVSVPPDRAVITFGVRKSSTDIAAAQTFVNSTLGKAVEKLKSLGVTEDAIQTSRISIDQDYSYSDDMSETAYAVENSVSVVLSDIDSVGGMIDAVFEAGANQFSGITFIATDTREAQEEAMDLAVDNAMARAKVLAEAAGMKLGDLLKITDNETLGYSSQSNGLYAKVEGAMDTFANQVYTSDVDVTCGVTLVYELLPIDRRTNRRN